MNVFANLESFEIKLCNYPSQTSHPSYRQNITKMKVKWDGNVDQAFCSLLHYMSAFISSYDNEIKKLKLVNATSLSVVELTYKLVL